MIPIHTRILVVDDMSTVRRIVKRIIGSMGLSDIVEAVDGQEGIEKATAAAAEGKPFDLIISDWNMPRAQGIDFLKAVRASKDEKLKNVIFVLLTAENQKEQVIEAMSAQVSDWIAKPFTDDILKAKVESVWAKFKEKKVA